MSSIEDEARLAARLEEARQCFSAERYFEAHEVLEDEWREAAGEPRLLLQGLIQAAAAWHHWHRGNRRGCASLAGAAAAKLAGAPDRWHDFPLGEYRDAIRAWDEWLRGGKDEASEMPVVAVGPRR